jgi:carbonic anhydrase
MESSPHPHPKTPDEALEVLLAGAERHRSGREEARNHSPITNPADGQQPFAALITCADSRLSPSRIFDVAPGNLFVSRVAGNPVDDGTLGGTEFAVAVAGVKLVMVLGHSDCGAMKAALEAAAGKDFDESSYGRIGAAIEPLLPAIAAVPEGERDLDRCVEANAALQAARLAETQPIIAPAVEAGELAVVAAVYDLGSRAITLIREG